MSVGFPREEYWCGLLCLSPGGLPNPGIEPTFPAWQVDTLPLNHLGRPIGVWVLTKPDCVPPNHLMLLYIFSCRSFPLDSNLSHQ